MKGSPCVIDHFHPNPLWVFLENTLGPSALLAVGGRRHATTPPARLLGDEETDDCTIEKQPVGPSENPKGLLPSLRKIHVLGYLFCPCLPAHACDLVGGRGVVPQCGSACFQCPPHTFSSPSRASQVTPLRPRGSSSCGTVAAPRAWDYMRHPIPCKLSPKISPVDGARIFV